VAFEPRGSFEVINIPMLSSRSSFSSHRNSTAGMPEIGFGFDENKKAPEST
jgi:hypothetical protein